MNRTGVILPFLMLNVRQESFKFDQTVGLIRPGLKPEFVFSVPDSQTTTFNLYLPNCKHVAKNKIEITNFNTQPAHTLDASTHCLF